MSCWDLLGIEPTRNRAEIDSAYERQRKFASADDEQALDTAYGEALSEAGIEESPATGSGSGSTSPPAVAAAKDEEPGQPMTADEHQAAREIVLQVRAMLNDSTRSRDVQMWRAILTESPGERPTVKAAVADSLAPDVRPLARNGEFPSEVCRFLGQWFGWEELETADQGFEEPAGRADQPHPEEEAAEEKPQMVNFWPAVIGWIVGLIILTSLFGSMTGG